MVCKLAVVCDCGMIFTFNWKLVVLVLKLFDSRSLGSNPYSWVCRPAGIDTPKERPSRPHTVTHALLQRKTKQCSGGSRMPKKIQKWAGARKTNKMTCAPSIDSDQPGHPPSRTSVFAMRLINRQRCKLSSCGQRRLWSDWADTQADLSLSWAHRSFCWFCHAVAKGQILHLFSHACFLCWCSFWYPV